VATETPLIALEHEELVVRKGRRTGVYTIIAVHSTRLGPALGGCRLWRYGSPAEATRDALRLSRAMTYKAAVAGLPLGGGKGVICAEPGDAPAGERRREMLLDFADTVNVLDGRYITAEDVGTSADDMSLVATITDHVTGLDRDRGGSGDPSPFTALGVERSIRACCARRFGTRDLEGRTVSVVGVGHVGSRLARRLAETGAEVTIADIDESKRALADELPGARWAEPTTALLAEADVVAPCALGGTVDAANVGALRARVVCGSANNQLAHEGLADDLAAREILYAPDFVANAGGLINISVELEPGGYDPETATARVERIEDTTSAILDEAEATATTPLAAGYALARRRLKSAQEPAPARDAGPLPSSA
jgi:leucine dehydrogenase